MYGVAKEYLRLKDNEFKYWKNGKYVFVNEGYFEIQNFLRPLPLGFLIIIAHILYPIGCYHVIANKLWTSWIINFWYGTWGGLAVTGGNHRLWCHRAYSAKLPLRIFLMLGQTMTFQYTALSWAIGHRVHHKYSDTDADPHTTSRGFFFAHAGWMFRKEHPDVSIKERLYNYSDLSKDGVLVFQQKYYYPLLAVMTFIIPMAIQVFIAGDTLIVAFLLSVVMRNISVFHDTAFVNSAAHMFGERPYNEHIPPSENFYVAMASFGEGYHNYHHSFPWDYKAAELGSGFNLTTIFIDAMAAIGQAYNLRTASDEVIHGGKVRNGILSVESITRGDKKAIVAFGQQLIDIQAKGVGVEVREEAPTIDPIEKSMVPPPGSDRNNDLLVSWAQEVIKNRKLSENSADIINYSKI